MSTNGDWRDAITAETEAERQAVQDAESYAEAQRLVQQYREEGIPDTQDTTQDQQPQDTQPGDTEQDRLTDSPVDTDPQQPVDQQKSSSESGTTTGSQQEYPDFIETDAQKAMWDDTHPVLRRKYKQAGGPEERAEVKAEWRTSRRQGEKIDYQGPITSRIEPEGGDLPGGFTREQLEPITTPEEGERVAERFPELYPEGATATGGTPLPGQIVVRSEAGVPTGEGYSFDPDDPVDVARWLSKREERQQSKERIAERRQAEEQLRTGEIETPQAITDREVLQQPVEIQATDQEQFQQQLQSEFAERFTEATVPGLTFEQSDVTLEETDEGGFRPQLSEEARQEIQQYRRGGFEENFRATVAETISGREQGLDIGPEDIGIRRTDEGLQPVVEASGREELQRFAERGRQIVAAREFDEQLPDTEVDPGDIRLGDDGPTLRENIQQEIEQRQRARAISELDQAYGRVDIGQEDIQREGGEFTLIDETRREIAANRFGVSPENVTLEGGQPQLTDEYRRKQAAEAFRAGALDISPKLPTEQGAGENLLTAQALSRVGPGDVELTDDGPTLDTDVQRTIAATQLGVPEDAIQLQNGQVSISDEYRREQAAESIRQEGLEGAQRLDGMPAIVGQDIEDTRRRQILAGVGEVDIETTDTGLTLDTDIQRELAAAQFGVDASAVELADGEFTLTEEYQREQAAETFSERFDTDISTGDIELTEQGARLREGAVPEQDSEAQERGTPDLEAIGVDPEGSVENPAIDATVDADTGITRPSQERLFQQTAQTPAPERTGIGGLLSAFDPAGLAQQSAETYQVTQEEAIDPAADIAEDIAGPGAGNIVTGVGRGVAGVTALPAVAYKGAELTGEAAEFTYENPLQAPGAGIEAGTEFVESEVEYATDKPLQYGGEIAGGGLVGYSFGKAAGPALRGTRTGGFLRRIDVGTRGQRRLRTEFRGLLDRDTADLGRESVIGSRLREQADRVAEVDFDEFVRSERGQLQIGRQRTPEGDRDVGDLMGEDIAGTDPDVGEGSRLADAPGGIDESGTTMTRTRGGSAERRRARARTEAERRDPSDIGAQEPGFEERYFDPQTGKVVTPEVDADLSPRLATLGAELGAIQPIVSDAATEAAQDTTQEQQQRVEEVQQPQVTEQETTLTGEATTPELDTRIDTDIDTQALTGLRDIEREQPRITPRITPETTPDYTPTTTTELTPTTTTTTTTDLDQPLITPDITPDPTLDPTPEPPTSPPPRPPRPPIPELDFDTDDRRQQAVPGGLQAGEFENPALAPGEAYSFDPFAED